MGGTVADELLQNGNAQAGWLMPRWMWFAPLGALVAGLAIWGFRLGWIAATITETDVINVFATRYLETAGAAARPVDCVARPGSEAGIWLVVSCEGAAGRFDYPVDRLGRQIDMRMRAAAPGAPET